MEAGLPPGRKLELRFERQAPPEAPDAASPLHLRLIVRLDFSDHEKLSHTRWIERVPADAPFKGMPVEVVGSKDASYEKIAALFDSLNDQATAPAKR
ncbi:MAG TPA: hypothetical protein VKG84_08790 [Candidatus Acidoferrales bacterium]|nr:hypothetical protein [Candidatus Acidoferrales bacterium]